MIRYRELNPRKVKTRRATRRLIEKGELAKKPCEVCGSARAEAHHEDYDDPRKVRWLCKKHHMRFHRKY